VELLSGQFIFGRNSCAEELSCPPSTAFKRMKKLEEMGNITIKSDRHFSIVTVCNWVTFQDKIFKKEQPSSNQVATKEHKQECKEGKECKTEAGETAQQQQLRKVIYNKKDLLMRLVKMSSERFDLTAEHCISHYQNKPIGVNPYEKALAWFKREKVVPINEGVTNLL